MADLRGRILLPLAGGSQVEFFLGSDGTWKEVLPLAIFCARWSSLQSGFTSETFLHDLTRRL